MNQRINQITSKSENKNKYFRNDNRIVRLLNRLDSYLINFWIKYKKKIPIVDLLRTQFPYILPIANVPPKLHIELTNKCNLTCTYCESPLGLRPRGFMTLGTFNNVIKNIDDLGLNDLTIGGNGEPTIHPKFNFFINELAKSTVKCFGVITNGHWNNEGIPYAMLKAPVDMVTISIDAGGKNNYEMSRKGGNYDKLMNNLKNLLQVKKKLNSPSLISINLMLRPSQRSNQKEFISYWKRFVKRVTPQYIYKMSREINLDEDIYIPQQHYNNQKNNQLFPKCSLIFKTMSVNWDGNVPLCDFSFSQVGPPDIFLGNINNDTLRNLWNSIFMKQYRNGHRYRLIDRIPICKGCPGI